MRAFEALGGVPTGIIRYDNLRPAVVRVALGPGTVRAPQVRRGAPPYGYASSTAFLSRTARMRRAGSKARSAGSAAGTEPGSRRPTRRRRNEGLAAADTADDARRIDARAETVGAAAAREVPLLRPLPAEIFDVSARCRAGPTPGPVSVSASHTTQRLQIRRPPARGPPQRPRSMRRPKLRRVRHAPLTHHLPILGLSLTHANSSETATAVFT